jgi:hypothetical protein
MPWRRRRRVRFPAFGCGDVFVQKIIGSADVNRPLQRIREFRNRKHPAIAMTVDLLTTGVDIPDLEFLFSFQVLVGSNASSKSTFLGIVDLIGTLADRRDDIAEPMEWLSPCRGSPPSGIS